MHVIVYCNEGPDTGLVYLTRELADEELLVERTFADRVASDLGLELEAPSGHIPNCCGDIRVEFMGHAPNVVDERYQGSTCIWSGESYYFAQEG
jgi:hypothetical protein